MMYDFVGDGAEAPTGPLRAIFGWVGCVSAWFLFLAPMPTMLKIRRDRSVGDFSDVPYLISSLQCSLWSVYALPAVTPGKLQPLVTNVVGAGLEFIYVLLFVAYAHPGKRWLVLVKLGIVVTFLGSLVISALLVAPGLDIPSLPAGASHVTTVLGFECMILNICMYAAPLSVVKTVLKKMSVKAMPLLLTVGCGVCSASWTVYALLPPADYYILVPNAAGLVLFAIQLTVYMYVVRNPPLTVSIADDRFVSSKTQSDTSSLLATASQELRRGEDSLAIADVGDGRNAERSTFGTGLTDNR